MQNNKVLWIGGLIVVVFIVWIAISGTGPAAAGELDTFATCLKDTGVKFYGAFWCPHCASQKALFGKSVKLLPYIECSTADTKGQLKVCADARVTNYPTWEFPPINGATSTTRLTGEVSLGDLSRMSNCPLPTTPVTSETSETSTGSSSSATE